MPHLPRTCPITCSYQSQSYPLARYPYSNCSCEGLIRRARGGRGAHGFGAVGILRMPGFARRCGLRAAAPVVVRQHAGASVLLANRPRPQCRTCSSRATPGRSSRALPALISLKDEAAIQAAHHFSVRSPPACMSACLYACPPTYPACLLHPQCTGGMCVTSSWPEQGGEVLLFSSHF